MAGRVYVVMGVTGEFDERVQWPVAAFTDRGAAEKRAELAREWLDENLNLATVDNLWVWRQKNKNPHDPNMVVTNTAVEWFIYDLEIEDSAQ
jgi:hypothetical protein